MIDPRDLSDDPEEQKRIWNAFLDEESARDHCPYSGETITWCKRTDLCDCFSFPEREAARR